MNTYDRPAGPGPLQRGPGSDDHLHALWTNAGMVETDRSLPEMRTIEAVHQAVVGDSAPMALFGFATGTLIVGLLLGGMMPAAAGMIAVVPALLFFAGIGQFIGGMFALTRGSTFGATAFCAFGMGNIIVASYTWMQQAGVIPTGTESTAVLGIGLFCLAYIALSLAIAALRTNVAYFLTVLALVPGYALVAANDVGAAPVVGQIGGWFLVVAALLAFYSGAAVVINSQWCRQVLPLGAFGRG